MKNFISLRDLTNRKIRYNVKTLLITSSIVTTILSMPNLILAGPPPDEKKKVSKFEQLKNAMHDKLAGKTTNLPQLSKAAVPTKTTNVFSSTVAPTASAPAFTKPPYVPPPPPIPHSINFGAPIPSTSTLLAPIPGAPPPPPPIANLQNFRPTSNWQSSNAQLGDNKENIDSTNVSVDTTKSNIVKTTVPNNSLTDELKQALSRRTSLAVSSTPQPTNNPYDISGIPTPPSSPERGRSTQTQGNSADISNLAQTPMLTGSNSIPMLPPPLLQFQVLRALLKL